MKNLFIPLLVILLLPFTSCASSVNSSKIDKLVHSAGNGDAYSQLLLGYKYYNGLDVPLDFSEAIKWYRKSAEQGYADAQIYMGTMCHNGEGTSVNYVHAHMWFNLAAAQGHVRGKELRDLIEEKMTPGQIAEAQKLALDWEARQ